jgi:hypothetical protein
LCPGTLLTLNISSETAAHGHINCKSELPIAEDFPKKVYQKEINRKKHIIWNTETLIHLGIISCFTALHH